MSAPPGTPGGPPTSPPPLTAFSSPMSKTAPTVVVAVTPSSGGASTAAPLAAQAAPNTPGGDKMGESILPDGTWRSKSYFRILGTLGWATGSSLVELTRDGMLMVRERVSLCDRRCGAGVQAAAMPLKDIVEWKLETSARVWSTLFKILFSWAVAGGIIFAVLRYLRRTSEGGAIAGAVLIPFPFEALWLLHWILGRKGFLYTTGRSDGQQLEGRVDRGRIAPLRIALAPRWRAAIAPTLPPRASGPTVTMLEVTGGAIEPDEEPEPLPPGYDDNPTAPGTPASYAVSSPAASPAAGGDAGGAAFAANPMRGAAAAVVTPGGVVAAATRGAGAEISMSSGAMSPHHLQKLDKETLRDAIRGKHLEGETLFHLTRKRFYTLRLYDSGTMWHTHRDKCFCCACLPAVLRCCTFAACDPVVTSFSHIQFMRYIAIEAFGRTIGKLFQLIVIFAVLACAFIGIIDALDTKTYLDVRAYVYTALFFALVLAPLFWWFCTRKHAMNIGFERDVMWGGKITRQEARREILSAVLIGHKLNRPTALSLVAARGARGPQAGGGAGTSAGATVTVANVGMSKSDAVSAITIAAGAPSEQTMTNLVSSSMAGSIIKLSGRDGAHALADFEMTPDYVKIKTFRTLPNLGACTCVLGAALTGFYCCGLCIPCAICCKACFSDNGGCCGNACATCKKKCFGPCTEKMTFYAPLRDVTVTAVGVTNMQTAFLRAGVFWVVCIIITILINSAYDIVWIGGIGGSLLLGLLYVGVKYMQRKAGVVLRVHDGPGLLPAKPCCGGGKGWCDLFAKCASQLDLDGLNDSAFSLVFHPFAVDTEQLFRSLSSAIALAKATPNGPITGDTILARNALAASVPPTAKMGGGVFGAINSASGGGGGISTAGGPNVIIVQQGGVPGGMPSAMGSTSMNPMQMASLQAQAQMQAAAMPGAGLQMSPMSPGFTAVPYPAAMAMGAAPAIGGAGGPPQGAPPPGLGGPPPGAPPAGLGGPPPGLRSDSPSKFGVAPASAASPRGMSTRAASGPAMDPVAIVISEAEALPSAPPAYAAASTPGRTSSGKAPLPPGWTEERAPDGYPYYVSPTGESSWERPT